MKVQTSSGAGVLARYGDSLVLAPADCPVLDEVLDLAREAAASHAEAPGKFLPRRTAGVVAQSDAEPTLAVLSALADGLALLLVGNATAVIVQESGTLTLTGRDSVTWVDHVVRGPYSSVTVTLSGAGSLDARSDLQGGVVSAAGFIATEGGAPAAAVVEPVVVQAPEPVFESFSLEPSPTEEAPATQALPILGIAVPDSIGPGVVVQGIECSRAHFNDPAAIYCAVCGISMVHQTHNLVDGVRPPLGVLVLDDGSVHALVGDLVLGREPEGHPAVGSGTATALTLDDPELTLSRVHARVELVGWDVFVVDATSANGTFVLAPGQAEWTRLPAEQPTVLAPGTRLSLGGRTLVFDSHQKR